MNATHRLQAAALSATLVLSFAAHAAGESIESRLVVAKIEATAAGVESKASAAQASPGDVLEYTAVYRNVSTSSVNNLSASIPVPAGTVYVFGSARPTPQLASLDGVNFKTLPLMREVRSPAGDMVSREIDSSEFRALRWTTPTLPAGQSVTPSIRVRVQPVETAAR